MVKESTYPSNPVVKTLAEEAGFEHPVQALFCVPIRYEPRVINVSESVVKNPSVPQAFTGVIRGFPEQISINPPIFGIKVKGKSGVPHDDIQLIGTGLLDRSCSISYWNEETEFYVSGVAKNDQLILGVTPCEKGKLFAVYKGKGRGVSKTLPKLVNQVFGHSVDQAIDQLKFLFESKKEDAILGFLNFKLEQTEAFPSLKKFFLALHFPQSSQEAMAAKKAAANLAAGDCCLRAQRASKREPVPESVIQIPGELVAKLISRISFKINEEQRAAMRDIWNDLKSDLPMYRLLSGDVGTGKTCVYAVIAAATHLIGKKVVVFAPNAALVHQVFSDISTWFPEIPLFRVTSEEKHPPSILENNPILIGTQAVLNWCKTHKNIPDFLVVDEQQKISRSQRESLMGKHTNFLEATATCIPRTFALMLYGGMKVSIIRQQPVKKVITTRVLFDDQKQLVFDHIHREIDRHAKVAVILPLVHKKESDGSEEIDVAAEKLAVESALKLWEKAFPGKVVGMHGKMPETEKISRLKEINDNKQINIIVATSLIEIGITIKNLRCLLIVEPDRYGVNSLHQMRGRLARNGGPGTAYLLLKKERSEMAEATLKRLELLETINDGFALAEADAEQRGWGDLAEDSEIQKGAAVTLFTHILIPQETISGIQSLFEDNVEKNRVF